MRRLFVVLGASALLVLRRAGAGRRAVPARRAGGRRGRRARDEAEVEDALDELQAEDGTQLFVVFVDTFDGADARARGCSRPRELSGLGGNDALLAVAVDDRDYALHPAGRLRAVRVDEANSLAGQAVEPEFAEGDWEAGVVAFADILRTGEASGAARLGLRRRRRDAARPRCDRRRRWGRLPGVARRGAASARRCRRRSMRLEKPDPYAGESTEQLQGRASNALLELDEAMKTSQLDLDFARVAVRRGRGRRLRQGAGDVPGRAVARVHAAPAAGRRHTGGRADHPADAGRDAAAHRGRRRPAGRAGRGLRAAARPGEHRAAGAGGARAADRRAARRASRRRSSGWPTCAAASPRRRWRRSRDNVTEAQARLAAAEQEVNEALDALGAGRPGDAVGDIRAAEDAVAQTTTLLDAVGRLATDLDAAGRPGGRRAGGDGEGPRRGARRWSRPGDRSGLRPADRPRRGGADLCRRGCCGPPTASPADPLAALRQLEEADIALEQALSVARDAQTQIRRAAAALDQALLTARSTIAAAADFIDTRRGAVGPEARTRLAEAQRHLEVAVDQGRDDPVTALREAHQAATHGAVGARPGAGRRLAVVRRRRRLRRRLRAASAAAATAGGAAGAASTSAASCSAGSCSAAAGAAASAAAGGGSASAVARLRRRRGGRSGGGSFGGRVAGGPAAAASEIPLAARTEPLGTVGPRWDGSSPTPRGGRHAHPRHPLAQRHALLGRLRRRRPRRHEGLLRDRPRLGVHRRGAGVRRLPDRDAERPDGRRHGPAAGPERPARAGRRTSPPTTPPRPPPASRTPAARCSSSRWRSGRWARWSSRSTRRAIRSGSGSPGINTGVQIHNEPGALAWNEAMVDDTAAAKQFYTAVFGFTFDQMSARAGR